MSKIVHELLMQWRKDPEGIERAMNKHIDNVSASSSAGGRWAAFELSAHLVENYSKEEALEKIRKCEKDWKKFALTRTKRHKP